MHEASPHITRGVSNARNACSEDRTEMHSMLNLRGFYNEQYLPTNRCLIALLITTCLCATPSHSSTHAPVIPVKIPDGIYFYMTLPHVKKPVLTPAFLVRSGKLLDPSIVMERDGTQAIQSLVADKPYALMAGQLPIGVATGLRVTAKNWCDQTTISPRISAVATYRKKLTTELTQPSRYSVDGQVISPSRIWVVPYSAKGTIRLSGAVSEAEQAIVVQAIQRELAPKLLKKMSDEHVRDWGAEYRINRPGESSLLSIEKRDLDGNGIADFFGSYHLTGRYGEMTDQYTVFTATLLFVFMNNRTITPLSFSSGEWQAGLLGSIDIDLDGREEIALVATEAMLDEGKESAERVELFRLGTHGWNRIYRSKVFCGDSLEQ